MTKLTYAVRTAALLGLLAPVATHAAFAQDDRPRPPIAPEAPVPPGDDWPRPRIYVNGAAMIGARGMLGVTLRPSSGSADTLGLLVDDVEDGLPADRAGIERGARLVSADGVDLRLDPRDLGDSAAEALPESRLRRLIARKDAGDTVTLVVLADRRTTTKRVALAESPMARSMRAMSTGRRVLGLSFSQRGSMRDTAGLLIVSITSGGAADKAGLNEGDRILGIDGIDLRVPEGDAGTADGVQARIARLRRALDAARDSEPVRLEVLADGQRRTLSVTPTRERGFTFNTAGWQGMADDIRASVRTELDRSGQREEMTRARTEAARARAEVQREMSRAQSEVQRETSRAQAQVQRDMARVQRDRMRMRDDDDEGSWSRSDDARSSSRTTVRGRTDGATLVIRGLSLAVVDRDFAQQFGRGAEEGALVVRTRSEWEPLKAGDVILRVEGRSVRDGNTLDIEFDRSRDQRLEILRDGRRETITLPSRR